MHVFHNHHTEKRWVLELARFWYFYFLTYFVWYLVLGMYIEYTTVRTIYICCCFSTHVHNLAGIFKENLNASKEAEVQTVILRCWTGLKLNWFKSYDAKRKYFCFPFFFDIFICVLKCFLRFLHFFRFCVFLHLCHNFWTN